MTPTQEDHEAAAEKLVCSWADACKRHDSTLRFGQDADIALASLVVKVAAALSEAVRVAVEKERAKIQLLLRERNVMLQAVNDAMADPSWVILANHGWETLKRWANGEALKVRPDAQATPAPEPPDFAAAERCICGHAFMYHTESPTRGCIVSAKHCPQFQPAYIRGTPPETGEKEPSR